ncbi:hypothetical protein ACA910_011961 [Epithemia clementina (nom. ined.)]
MVAAIKGLIARVSSLESGQKTNNNLEARVEKLESVASLQSKVRGNFGPNAPEIMDQGLDEEDDWMLVELSEVASGPKRQKFSSQNLTKGDEDIKELSHPMAIICRLLSGEKEVMILKAGSDALVIKFGSLGVSGIEGLRAWMMKHCGPRCYRFAFDIYVIFEHISEEEERVTNSAMLSSMEKRVKLRIKNVADSRVIQAFANKTLRLLCNGIPKAMKDTSFLTAIPRFKDWREHKTGVQSRILEKLSPIFSATSQSIREAFSGVTNNKGYTILVQALSNTQTFVQNLVAFIDKTMEDLVGNSDFDERKAWSLTTQLWLGFSETCTKFGVPYQLRSSLMIQKVYAHGCCGASFGLKTSCKSTWTPSSKIIHPCLQNTSRSWPSTQELKR